MKWTVVRSLGFLFLAAVLLSAGAAPSGAARRPEHAVIFIIDGLSYKAPARLELRNLRALMAEGTYYEKSYNILPADPRSGEWTRHHTCSIPNPAILAGTVLLRPDQHYVQQCFFPDRTTAHAANVAYASINSRFHLTFLHGPEESPANDGKTMYWGLEFLRRARPVFMKVHLQHTGNAGAASRNESSPSIPWRRNIWAENSPYRRAAAQADQHLGRLLDELKALGLKDKTLLFVTADHGQADAGWHPYDDEDAWVMPLAVAGPGIRAGQRFEYAEQIDIVPTLCHLMGVKPPKNADGRVLAEALVSPPGGVPPQRKRIKELNALIRDADVLIAKLRPEAEKSPALKDKLAKAEREYYGLEHVLQWHRFGTMDRLLAHNRRVLEKLASLLGPP
ncbi:MAG: sulfatase-like hydrolase/transferase [Acidobacteriota bacterium]